MNDPREHVDVDSLVRDPADYFASPMQVVGDARLTREDKKRILEAWIRDAELLSQAEAENMPGKEPTRLREAHLALLALKEQQ